MGRVERPRLGLGGRSSVDRTSSRGTDTMRCGGEWSRERLRGGGRDGGESTGAGEGGEGARGVRWKARAPGRGDAEGGGEGGIAAGDRGDSAVAAEYGPQLLGDRAAAGSGRGVQ